MRRRRAFFIAGLFGVARRRQPARGGLRADLLAEDDEADAEGDQQTDDLEEPVASAALRARLAVTASVHALHATTVNLATRCGVLQR